MRREDFDQLIAVVVATACQDKGERALPTVAAWLRRIADEIEEDLSNVDGEQHEP